ncbi:MAG: DUF3179 domain-containing protein [Candidatus Kariarchaeaceae archaeon]|jgi:hypothetical protein
MNSKQKKYSFSVIAFTLTFISFSNIIPSVLAAECLVPCGDIISGGPSKDGIPAIETPIFISATEFENEFTAAYLDKIFVLGLVVNGEPRAYPRDILNWHEIVNDDSNGNSFSVTFCPLTGSGIVYNTTNISGSTLGTTGRLYENNLVFYDRISNTYWSQMLGLAITGKKMGETLPIEPIVETSWKAWKSLYPETKVLSRDSSGWQDKRDYDVDPYPGYRDRLEIWFKSTYNPSVAPSNLYFEKSLTMVLNLDTSNTNLYPFEELAKITVLNDKIENTSLVIFFDEMNELAMSYNSTLESSESLESGLVFKNANGTDFSLDPSKTLSLPIFQDQTGTVWNFQGQAIYGPLEGAQLQPIASYNAFWFAATALFHNTTIFTGNTSISFNSTYNPIDSENTASTAGDSLFIIIPITIAGLMLLIIIRKR